MSLALFLVDAVPDGGPLLLSGTEGHHAADVARLRRGEQVLIGDGRGSTGRAQVAVVERGQVRVEVLDRWLTAAPTPRLVVAQGLAKGDRAELAVQAMTEVGVDAIIPWAARRCVVRWRAERADKGVARWQAVSREAAKQARRAYLPEIRPLAETAELAGRVHLVLHEEAEQPLSTVPLPPGPEVVLAVGPEGGIDPDEVAQLSAAGAVPVRLGAQVLRTSTAGVAALAVLNARLGRW